MCNWENAWIGKKITSKIKIKIATKKANARRTCSQFPTARRVLAEKIA